MKFCYVTIDNNVTDRHLLTSCGCQTLPPAPPTPPSPDPEIIATTYYWLIGLFLALAVIAGSIAGGLYYMHRKKIGFWKPKKIYDEDSQISGSRVPLTEKKDNTDEIQGESELKRSPSDLTTGGIAVDANSTTSAPEEHNAGNLGSAGNDPNQSSGTLGATQNQSSGSAGNVQSQPDGSSAQSGQDDGTISQNGSSANVRSEPKLDNGDSNRSMTQ